MPQAVQEAASGVLWVECRYEGSGKVIRECQAGSRVDGVVSGVEWGDDPGDGLHGTSPETGVHNSRLRGGCP